MSRILPLSLLFALSAACSGASDRPTGGDLDQAPDMVADQAPDQATPQPLTLRVATYNTSLFGQIEGDIVQLLSQPDAEHPRKVAAVLQTIRPDIVLLNEFDYDAAGEAARLLRENFLQVGQGQLEPLEYPYVYVAKSNTGVPSGHDLDRDGQVVTRPGGQSYGNDSYGFGLYEGQYSFVILSRFPIEAERARTFQKLRWQDLPGHMQPVDFYGEEAAAAMRLSSKNHVDVPVTVGPGRTLHILASHPTPPSFDGPEDRNGRRNHDEIALWTTYLTPSASGALVDDAGVAGGLAEDAAFVLLGDLNSDPEDGDSIKEGIRALLAHPRVQDPKQTSEGGRAAAERDGQANTQHKGDAGQDTADFSDRSVGNLRADYALPSKNLKVVGGGVFWPLAQSADAALTAISDHHPVWVDLEL